MSSKRKNPLRNLDDFLKQEASTLVTPNKFSEPKKEAPPEEAPQESLVSEKSNEVFQPVEVTQEHVIKLIHQLAAKNKTTVKKQLMELVKHIIEENGLDSSNDKMLINTILYLEDPENWRDKIAAFWEK